MGYRNQWIPVRKCQPVPQPARDKDMGLAIGHVGKSPQPSHGRIWGTAISRFRRANCQPVPQPARGKDMGLAIGHVGNFFLSPGTVCHGDGASTWQKVH